ncbi:hypothetical protein BH11PAT4_BH11PAT4_8890 [soil metagenome]
MATQTGGGAPTAPHHVRTFFAAIFGIVAFVLILASILVVWLNRTLLDTSTFVATVSPVTQERDVQNFIADKLTTQLLESAPTEDIAGMLLTEAERAGKNQDQLKLALDPVIRSSVQQVVQGSEFSNLFKATLESKHADFIAQLKAGGSVIALDFSPAVAGALNQLKATKLGSVAEKLTEEGTPEVKVDLKGSALDEVYKYYKLFTQTSLILLAVMILMIALSVGISVNHAKTLRRIVIGTGVMSLVLAVIFQAPKFIAPQLGEAEQKAAAAVAGVLLHNLQLATIVLGVVCIVLAVASKFLLKPKKA